MKNVIMLLFSFVFIFEICAQSFQKSFGVRGIRGLTYKQILAEETSFGLVEESSFGFVQSLEGIFTFPSYYRDGSLLLIYGLNMKSEEFGLHENSILNDAIDLS
jgi:hypothetical protein